MTAEGNPGPGQVGLRQTLPGAEGLDLFLNEGLFGFEHEMVPYKTKSGRMDSRCQGKKLIPVNPEMYGKRLS
jgi:hypothetical protein